MNEVTCAQMRALEKCADSAGLSYLQMMERAGRQAVRILTGEIGVPASAAVFCGKGNNGGDGLVMARLLAEAGCRVRVFLPDGEPATPQAKASRARLSGCGAFVQTGPLRAQDEAWAEQAAAVVDALYGTGFHGEMRAAGARAARCINRCRGFVVCADVPSGVCADTGAAAQDAVKADLTVTFHARKPCHRLAGALCGRVKTADIGLGALCPKVP